MRNFIYFIAGILLIYGELQGQNLVVNPSFENRSGCPTGPSEMNLVNNWDNAYVNIPGPPSDTCSTSDYYHSCNWLGSWGMDVPDNVMGSEPARTGSAYCGIITFSAFPLSLGSCSYLLSDGWREYLVGQLSSPLVAGQNYCVSFYVSLADDATWATGDFHVYLTNSWTPISCASVGSASHLGQFITPQLRYDGSAITQKNGWTRLQWDYVATGGEQWIILGNFDNDANTTDVCAYPSSPFSSDPYAYYYIDDVSVEPGNCLVLPLVLTFKAYKYKNANVLAWKFENPKEVKKIELYKSPDENTWEKLAELEEEFAPGYYEDYSSHAHKKVFYRLDVTSIDGNTESYYAQILNSEINFDFFPNPVKDKLTITGDVQAKFYTVYGREIEVPWLSINKLKKIYDFSEIPKGSYILKITSSSGEYSYNIVKY